MPDGRRTDHAARRDPGWDEMPDDLKPVLARQMELYAGFLEQTDHEVGRVVDAHRRSRRPRRHADLLHHRRQRRFGRGHAERLLQRDDDVERDAGHRDNRVPAVQDRRFRHAEGLQPLRGGLGTRVVRAVSVDQAGGLALGRHPQRHHRALAQRADGKGRDPQPVPSRHRRGPDHPGGGRAARAAVGERHRAGAAGGGQHAAHAARWRCARDARRPVLRDDGQSRHLPPGLDGGDQTPHAVEGRQPAAVRRRRLGAVRARRLDPGA